MNPSFFVDNGLAVAKSLRNAEQIGPEAVAGIYEIMTKQLMHFQQGGARDAQRSGDRFFPEFVDYATIAIGLYGAAAEIPIGTLLSIQNSYASLRSHSPKKTEMDEVYTHLPKRNAINTEIGYDLYRSGRIGPSSNP